jgi:ketosteroid isomerase-like protein
MILLRSAFFAFFALVALGTGAIAEEGLHNSLGASNARWIDAYNRMDGSGFAAMYASDAVLMTPGKAPIRGAEAIGQFWADLVKPGNRRNITIEPMVEQGGGDIAYQAGRWSLDLVAPDGAVKRVSGNAVRIFERGPAGAWLIKTHIFNVE